VELLLLLVARLKALERTNSSRRCAFEIDCLLRRFAKILSQARRQQVDHLQRVRDLVDRRFEVIVHVSRLSSVAGCGMIRDSHAGCLRQLAG
jgi:hypothetical protein